MSRRATAITVVFLLSLAVRASAEPPRQADIDACNKEAAAAEPHQVASPETGKAEATDQAPRADSSASGKENVAKEPHTVAPTPSERQAFAACLARHGYYKGYYH